MRRSCADGSSNWRADGGAPGALPACPRVASSQDRRRDRRIEQRAAVGGDLDHLEEPFRLAVLWR
jgi:hypothetical protein